jgi:uncharacterized protein YlxP (DUF503 family)
VFTATAIFDLLLPDDSRSLKDKRGYLRPILAELRKFEVAAAEVGDHDRHGRAQLGVAAVAGESSHAQGVVDRCERAVADRPEIELLSVRRRLFGSDD